MTSTPTPPRKGSSGEHPAVQAYRDKLDSVVEHTELPTRELDERLAKYLEEVRTPVPPPLDEVDG